jgi:PucR family transcriptional regulator, purine catabolism regulatory protein
LSLVLVDVLAHEVFLRAGAEVLTGPVPQGRQVRWVHSTEVYEVAPLLRGGELLLTTGLGLAGSGEQDRRAYVRAVADAGLAALALELGWTFDTVPPDMLAEARDAGLPLVALHSRVPFAEITEAVNSSIVDRSIVQLRYADEMSRTLSEALLGGADLGQLLDTLSNLVHATVLLVHPDGRTLAVVTPDGRTLAAAAADDVTADDLLAAGGHSAPVMVDGVPWATLVVGDPGPAQRDLVASSLERACPAFALELQRSRSDVAARAGAGRQLLRLLLGGDPPPREVQTLAAACGLPVADARYVGVVVPPGVPGASALVLEAAREVSRTRVLAEVDGVVVAVVAVPSRGRGMPLDARLAGALQARLPAGRRAQAAVGSVVGDLAGVSTSLRLARGSLDAAAVSREPGSVAVAARLTTERLLLGLSAAELLELVDEHLGPLVALRSPRREDLLTTLEVYLDSAHSKAVTARRLGLVRQSLYQRLARIAELLDHDIDDARVADGLRLALRAWRIGRSVRH